METVAVKVSFAYFQNAISKQFLLLVYAVLQHALQFSTDIDKRMANFHLRCISDEPAFFCKHNFGRWRHRSVGTLHCSHRYLYAYVFSLFAALRYLTCIFALFHNC